VGKKKWAKCKKQSIVQKISSEGIFSRCSLPEKEPKIAQRRKKKPRNVELAEHQANLSNNENASCPTPLLKHQGGMRPVRVHREWGGWL